ncbi:MAG: hypothetical protein A2W72_20975 [Burkholderiales bacterium RIFCSPLOWO2_12_67_14]|nr:MAG: hypothetical protein A3I64_13840 [Burkholderiales bacterium RIFCSPLOWO2_02_FULL_67_64]OGB38960.1 MAG: hypothetical protein A3E51_04555 [Burkholderiales bacterium RIFCSPHIGHO2_12_FULL_67_38]OGB44413.1 MAG: hypothetical protein A2W72_20975 [Burkholderiales bacterium RIFCSPLOWO2_12_67_14]OGB83189.1 MAG: hypothetical protein A3G82_15200 [Burkholderiales bacterium RIFCSPLOWO2_12_FULL_67_210]
MCFRYVKGKEPTWLCSFQIYDVGSVCSVKIRSVRAGMLTLTAMKSMFGAANSPNPSGRHTR